MDRSLELEVVEVEHGQDHHVGAERLEEPRAEDARPYPKGVEPRPLTRREGNRRLGCDVAHRASEGAGQEVDERLEMMPVLVGLRVEHDVAMGRGELLEAAV